MPALTPQQLIECLQWRYAVKRFEASRKIDTETWQALQSSLVLAPSSYGLQPWKFMVITDEATKAKLPAISWNQKQPQDCSHMVVLAARRQVDPAYVDKVIDHIESERQLAGGTMSAYRNFLMATVGKSEIQHLDWNARQVYIALGQLMTAAAVLGVDACPMEGINAAAYDQLLGLTGSDYTTVVGCALGYRHQQDQQAALKKVRFSASEIVTQIGTP